MYILLRHGSFVGLGEPGVPIVQPALGNAIFLLVETVGLCHLHQKTMPIRKSLKLMKTFSTNMDRIF